jgi:amidase
MVEFFLSGEDKNDPATKNPKNKKYLDNLKTGTLKGLRFGVNKTFRRFNL